MASGAMTYKPVFVKIGSDILKLIGGGGYDRINLVSSLQNKGSRIIIQITQDIFVTVHSRM
jgi:hypothetical protein